METFGPHNDNDNDKNILKDCKKVHLYYAFQLYNMYTGQPV